VTEFEGGWYSGLVSHHPMTVGHRGKGKFFQKFNRLPQRAQLIAKEKLEEVIASVIK